MKRNLRDNGRLGCEGEAWREVIKALHVLGYERCTSLARELGHHGWATLGLSVQVLNFGLGNQMKGPSTAGTAPCQQPAWLATKLTQGNQMKSKEI